MYVDRDLRHKIEWLTGLEAAETFFNGGLGTMRVMLWDDYQALQPRLPRRRDYRLWPAATSFSGR
jgi:hypothetical protein